MLSLLAACWIAYFAIHSLLASLSVKHAVAHHWPGFVPWYRIIFNLLAILLIIPPLYLLYTIGGDPVWEWRGSWAWIMNGIAAVAMFGFFYSLRFYDGSEFLGIRQLQEDERSVEDQEHFRLSPLHYCVRHPWYFLGLLLIWTRDMPPAMLLTAVLATIYFILGSWFEERKLMVYHGEVYAEYRRLVPALLPLPWRCINTETAQRLQRQAHTQD